MKMCEYCTAEYSDGRTLYEITLAEAYQRKNGANVTIKPTIWLWGAPGVYFVDYVGRGVGCTMAAFDALADAEKFKANVQSMERDEFKAWLLHRGDECATT